MVVYDISIPPCIWRGRGPYHWIRRKARQFEVESSTRPNSRPSLRSPQYTRPPFLDSVLVVNSTFGRRPNPRGSLSGPDRDKNSAWEVEVAETSKEPSKGNPSNISARSFDVVPTISRMGGEGGEEPGCWTKERFSPALVVSACTVYRCASVFGVAPAEWIGVSSQNVRSFSRKMFAVIGEFDVVRLKEELTTNVP